VKSFNQSGQELELVSPVKRIGDNIERNVSSDEELEEDMSNGDMSENLPDEIIIRDDKRQGGPLKFKKTTSEHSLGASSDRTTPEPNPSSGYSSEPQPDPPSPGYLSDHSSPGKVQVSSPDKPDFELRRVKPNIDLKTEKVLKKLEDKMSIYFSPVGTRRKRKSRFADVKPPVTNDEIVNESAHDTPPRNMIGLHSDSPLTDVKDEIVPVTPKVLKKELKSRKSEENDVQSKIRIPRELSGLNDLMSPFFSAGEGKRKSALRPELVSKKDARSIKRRQKTEFEDGSIADKKKSKRQSMRPLTYKEKDDSDDSQTDEEELVRLVEERYEKSENASEEQLHEHKMDYRNTPEKRNTKPIIDLTSPARFKCSYCAKKFKSRKKLLDHQQEELEQKQARNVEKRKCLICETIFQTVEELSLHGIEAGCRPRRLSDVTTLDLQSNQEFNIGKGGRSSETCKTPKLVAQLQDKLSGYYSPTTSQVRARKVPERLVEMYTNQAPSTPKSSKMSSRKFFRTKTLALSTSTPNDDGVSRSTAVKSTADTKGSQFLRKRSARDKNISYADFPDFDSSNTEESDVTISPDERTAKLSKNMEKKKFVLASSLSPPKENISPQNHRSPTHSSRSVVTLSPSVTKHFKQKKKRSLSVKNLNDSQEILDVSSALDESQEMDTSPIITPSKSTKTFLSPGKYFSIAQVTETPTGQIRMKLNRISKPHQPYGTPVTAKKSSITPENKANYKNLIIPRLNRSACKEMGLSPNKLQSIIAASPIKGLPAPTCTEKENVPSISETSRQALKLENRVTKTPRIRIKKIPSGGEGTDAVPVWKAEPVFSPRKQSPLKSLPHRTSPSKAFSPLTERSIHKLTMSPIIHTQVNPSNRLKKKKVNKQLAYL